MRLLAFDLGQKRCGVAVSDADATLATPLCVLDSADVLNCTPTFRQLVDQWQPYAFICGWPQSLSGNRGTQALRIEKMLKSIIAHFDIPYVLVDERLSSKEAKRVLHELGYTEKSMRGKLDKYAAAIILDRFLERLHQKMAQHKCSKEEALSNLLKEAKEKEETWAQISS